MKRIFVPTRSGSDWQPLLGKPKLHWKQGRSAMSAAACWEDSANDLPREIVDVLEATDDPALLDLELLAAIPEWETALPGKTSASQTDILALTRNESGLVILAVEAKVDEAFGPLLGEKRAEPSPGQTERIKFLEQQLSRSEPFPDHIRYQLLHRSVSALLTARAFHAPVAVMMVQSFCPKSTWRDDFEEFCQLLSCTELSSDVREVPGTKGARLLLAWSKGDQKYRETLLPSAL